MDSANTVSISKQFKKTGETSFEIMNMFRSFNAYAGAFRKESDAHEK
jgi:hypothetical protein